MSLFFVTFLFKRMLKNFTDFSDFFIRNLVLIAILVRGFETFHAEASLQRTGLIIDASVNYATVVARLMQSCCVLAI